MPVARKVWQLASAEPDGFNAALDHPKYVDAAHPTGAHPARARHRAPQGRVFLGRDPGRGEIGVKIGLRLVVDRDGVVLPAFFLEPDPPALTLLVVVLDAHADNGRDAGWSTGVLPVLTTWVGPRTEAAGLAGTTCPTTSQSNSRRMAARYCLIVGAQYKLCISSM